ncbi:hypothetical protein DFQ27_004929 [Actinomortierella ambigua]|uniref:Uncharacterized protein n=1 Tax=Actinomortierella ambigua TaxID=1343610 RepID=A0A9P6Q2W8_9FUNG|nr:hypothetical protein DFQ27_004929 [Actinomortierella ambigua]
MASKRLKDAEIWINHMATTLRNKDILSSSSADYALDTQPATGRGLATEQQQQQRSTGATAGIAQSSATKAQQRTTKGGVGHHPTSGAAASSTTTATTTTPLVPPKPMAIDQDETSVELQLDILLQRALFSAATDQRTEAVEILARGMEAARAHQALWPAGMQRYTVLYMLALAELYMDAPLAATTGQQPHYPQSSKGGGQHRGGGGGAATAVGVVSTAIPLLLTTMTLSEQRCQRGLFFLATLRLAEALLHLGAVQLATQLVEGIMTQVLGQADLYTQATAFFQYGKCLLAQLTYFVIEDDEEEGEEAEEEEEKGEQEEEEIEESRQQHLAQVLHLLQRAIEGFQQLDAVEDVQQVLYFVIRCHYELGEDQLVAGKLRLFRELGQQARQDQHHRPPSWFAYYYLRHDLTDLLTAPQTTPQRSPTSLPR